MTNKALKAVAVGLVGAICLLALEAQSWAQRKVDPNKLVDGLVKVAPHVGSSPVVFQLQDGSGSWVSIDPSNVSIISPSRTGRGKPYAISESLARENAPFFSELAMGRPGTIARVRHPTDGDQPSGVPRAEAR